MLRELLKYDPYDNFWKENPLGRIRKLFDPRYVFNRVRLVAYERSHPDQPWLTREAIERLEKFLQPSFVGLEWGSGNGTKWFARRSRKLTSVEHHAAWYAKVKSQLTNEGLSNVDYRLVTEEDYTKPIDEIADGSLDYVLVDALLRDVTFAKSMPKVRPGGWIVFDNCNWHLPSNSTTPHSRSLADGPATPLWAEVLTKLDGWTRIWTTNGVNDTAIYIKP